MGEFRGDRNGKANGNLRLCLDPKALNKALKRCHFPMLVIEDILPCFSSPCIVRANQL